MRAEIDIVHVDGAPRPSTPAGAPGQVLGTARTWLAHAGSLRDRRRLARALECGSLFIGLPLVYAAWWVDRVAMLPVLWLVALLCGIALWRDPTFDRQILSWARRPASPWRRIALFLAIGTSAILAAILWLAPELVFDTPREQPLAWLVMLIAYPLLSVIPQEFVWRTFFMHRYRDLFGSRHAMVAASALTFGLGHIIFLHPLPVVLTAIAGVAFGYTYLRARSLWPVVFEHALYGCMLFTVGLGSYFTMSQAVGAPGILP